MDEVDEIPRLDPMSEFTLSNDPDGVPTDLGNLSDPSRKADYLSWDMPESGYPGAFGASFEEELIAQADA